MKNNKFISIVLSLLMYMLYLGIGIYIGCATHAKYEFLYFVGVLIYTLYIAFREGIQWKQFDVKYKSHERNLYDKKSI